MGRIIIPFVVALNLAFVVPATSWGSDPEGPGTCERCWDSGPYLAPVVRALALDAAMYGAMWAIWPDAFRPSAGHPSQFARAWTMPPYADTRRTLFSLDGDPAFINGVLHPLYGSEVYLSARTWGQNPLVSFVYSMAASLVWEYLIESWFQRPSLVDLVWTPFAGAAIGEFRYLLLQRVQKRIEKKAPRVILMTLLDPLGQLERTILQCEL